MRPLKEEIAENDSYGKVLSTRQSLEIQQMRAQLRERFLRLISHLSGGENCRLQMYKDFNHTCQIRGFDVNFENVVVENLSTNYPQPIKQAIVRATDIISLHFEVDSVENLI